MAGTRVRLTEVDAAPEDLYAQIPRDAVLIQRMAGPDRPDYWIARLAAPLGWSDGGVLKAVDHLVLCARFAGQTLDTPFDRLVVGIAYVVDATLLSDPALSFDKVRYIAIGVVERRDP
jgi:hypothetical protein